MAKNSAERAQRDETSKRELAMELIRRIRSMDREKLHEVMLEQAGEELAQFFLSYATDLMEREPARAVENASSLLLIGYLIRCFEQDLDLRATLDENPLVHQATKAPLLH